MEELLQRSNISSDLTRSILLKYNNREIGRDDKAILKSIPNIDNKTIIDFTNIKRHEFTSENIDTFFKEYDIPQNLYKKCLDSNFILSRELLTEIGIYLYPKFSYGVLNGGSATSYVDIKNNKKFSSELFNNFENIFKTLTDRYKNRAKGITPAFINPSGTPGPTFMELKMRSLLLEAKRYREVTNRSTKDLFPMFQMTSTTNNSSITDFYISCKKSPYLNKLISETNIDITYIKTGIQPLIAAYTHSTQGEIKDIFIDKNGNPLPLPGGHGQCFYVLKDIFNDLYKNGIRFISIGNVDNIGYTLDPKALAILAITGKQATFDFSYKTSFDIKGGVLIKDQFDRINCADLGVAVSRTDISEAEKQSIPILFNCATGIFNLEYLINNIDYITEKLPTRFTDQNKDVGEYSQAEQVTWEVMSLLDDFLIFAVDKYDRFLASKLLIENLVTSGFDCNISDKKIQKCAVALNKGLTDKLRNNFNLILKNGEWIVND